MYTSLSNLHPKFILLHGTVVAIAVPLMIKASMAESVYKIVGHICQSKNPGCQFCGMYHNTPSFHSAPEKISVCLFFLLPKCGS